MKVRFTHPGLSLPATKKVNWFKSTQKQASELVREIDMIISEIANNVNGIKKY